jgi:hypothetical protein
MSFPKFRPSKKRKIEAPLATVATVATRRRTDSEQKVNVASVARSRSPSLESEAPAKTLATSCDRCDTAHPEAETRPNVADVATVAGGIPENEVFEDLYFEFEERAALLAEASDISQAHATEIVAQRYGFACSREFYDALTGQRAGDLG